MDAEFAKVNGVRVNYCHIFFSLFLADFLCYNTKIMHVKLLQSCMNLCNPMDHSPPGSSVHGILQARILEWVAIPFSRESFQPWDQTLHLS